MWSCALRLPKTKSRECVSTCDAVGGRGRCVKLLSSQVHSSEVGVPGLPLAEGAGGAAAGDDHGWSEGHCHQGGLHG